MTLMERPMFNRMVESSSTMDLAKAVWPRFARLLRLNHTEWMHQLGADGFDKPDINRLDEFVATAFDDTELADALALILEDIDDLEDEMAVDSAIEKWIGLTAWEGIWTQVGLNDFPDPIDAAAYAGTHLLSVATSTLAFEALRRNPPAHAVDDWRMDSQEIQEGIELAESGLAEEAAEWPPY